MAVYLLTLHSFGSWLPDRAPGYVRRRAGVLPADEHMAGYYRDAMTRQTITFDDVAQRVIIDAVREKAKIKSWTCHGIATDPSHAHILLAWIDYTDWQTVRRALKSSITRRLNECVTYRRWLVAGGSRKRIHDRGHYHHLMTTYLPSHRGRQWYRASS